MDYKITSIGVVHSAVKDGLDENWGTVVSEIQLEEQYQAGLLGLDGFSHAIILFFMHKSNFDNTAHLQRHPQDRMELPLVGIFAQRAKHRPNPIGITAVKILSVDGNCIKVMGLDAIDGTPVVDIKPYFPEFDCKNNVTKPDWVTVLMKSYF